MSDISAPRLVHEPDRRALATDRLAFLLAGLVVFLSPYNVLRHPALYFTAADAVTVMAFLVLLVGGRLPLAPFGRLTPVWYGGFLALVGGLVIGSIAHQRLIEGLHVILQYSFALVILPWVLSGRSFEQAQRLLLIWSVSIVVVMLHGIYLMEIAADPPPNLVSPSGRLLGVIERANELAAIGAMALVVTLYLSAERILSPLVTLLFAVVLLYGIVLTASNTGVMAVAVGVVAFTLFQRSVHHWVMLVVLVGLSIAAILVGGESVLPDSFMRRVAGALTTGDLGQAGTFDDRMALTREGWQASNDHVLVGLGAEGFRRISFHRQPVHNAYVLMLVEGGILSLAGLCLLIAASLLRGATLMMETASRNLGAMMIAMSTVFALVLNAVPHIYARFWLVPIILALALSLSDHQLRRRGRFPTRIR